MSEARLLWMVSRYPNPTALMRRLRDVSAFGGLGRLEGRGLVRRQRGQYLLTKQGRNELVATRAIMGLVFSAWAPR